MANKKNDNSKLFAFLAVLLSVIGFILAYAFKKDDKYVMFYAKQSLVLFFTCILLWVAAMILSFIPFIGIIIYWVIDAAFLILWIVGLVYSLSGEMKEIPIVGEFAKKFNF